jgi:hypothetical protein
MPLPDPFPSPPPGAGDASPARIAAALARQLARHGLTRIYTAASRRHAVISVTAEVTVWTDGVLLWCTCNGQASHLGRRRPRRRRRPPDHPRRPARNRWPALTPRRRISTGPPGVHPARTRPPGMTANPGSQHHAGQETSGPRLPWQEQAGPPGCRPAPRLTAADDRNTGIPEYRNTGYAGIPDMPEYRICRTGLVRARPPPDPP